MTELLVVAGEPVWPSAGGGGGRTAWLVAMLAARFSVRVLAPVDGAPPDGLPLAGVDPLPDEQAVRRAVILSPQSRRGRALLGPFRSRALLQAIADHRPRTVLFVGGHLAAAAPALPVPVFVDFPELEVRSSGLEAWKARWWEPVEARRAVLASASSADAVAVLESWGARAVLVEEGAGVGVAALLDAVDQVVRAPVTS